MNRLYTQIEILKKLDKIIMLVPCEDRKKWIIAKYNLNEKDALKIKVAEYKDNGLKPDHYFIDESFEPKFNPKARPS